MVVHVHGLQKSFGAHRVLDGVDFQAAEGTVLALLGPNGAGKTTAVRVMTTLTRPDAGTVTIAGHDVVTDAFAVRGVIGLTGQFAAVDDRQTGRENLTMVGRLRHLGRRGAARRAADLLEQFDLVDAADRRVGVWSGGMRRRLDLAMSIVAAPRVLFLDEPTTGLDPSSRTTMWTAIGELVHQRTTVVLTTQYLEEADRLADHVVLLDRGRVAAEGAPDALKSRVGGERVILRFAEPSALSRGLAVLAPHAPRPDAAPLTAVLASDGSADHVRRVLDDLHRHRVPVESVATTRPTLDDVFLALTGVRPAADATEPLPA